MPFEKLHPNQGRGDVTVRKVLLCSQQPQKQEHLQESARVLDGTRRLKVKKGRLESSGSC